MLGNALGEIVKCDRFGYGRGISDYRAGLENRGQAGALISAGGPLPCVASAVGGAKFGSNSWIRKNDRRADGYR